MAGRGPGAARWGRWGAAALGLALALACLLLRGALVGAAALGAAGAWCAMRPLPPAPRPPGKTAANGGPAAASGRHGRTPPRRFGAAPRCPPQALCRRYPLPQARAAAPGGLPAARWEGCSPRSTPWARRAAPLRSPSTVRIAGMARSPLAEPLSSPSAFLGNSTVDPCARETVLNAIKESRKRAVEEEEDEQPFEDKQESKRKRHDSSGSGQSAFEPLVANGAPTSLIPKPGSLKRGLVSHCPDDCSNKRSRTSSMSSLNNMYASGIPSSTRNAIASSYSSSGGLSQLWKRSGVSMSPLSSPTSSRPQTPEWPLKKAREEEFHRSNTSTPVKSDKELQTEKVVETPVQKKQNSLSPPSALGSSGKRKRKIPLLRSQPGDQLTLPPPPQLGYSVTSEDLDAEKKATLQWFNKVLEDKTVDTVPSTTAETSPGSVPALTAPAPASTSSLLDSLKKMQSSQAVPTPADSAGAAVASQPPSSAAQPPAPAVSLESSSVPATSADTKPVPALSSLAPAAPPALGTQAPSSLAPSAFTELGQTPSKPPSFPKPSVLFGVLSTPPASQPATTMAAAVPTAAAAVTTTTAAVTTTTPVFKPIFGALPKSESVAPCTAVVSTTVTVSASSGPSSTSSTTTMFKPIFVSVTTASSPVKAFKPTSQPAPAADLPAASTTTLGGFTGVPNVIVTTAATTATTQSSSADATVKPVFRFGLNAPTSTGPAASLTVTTAMSTSTMQPFLFGTPATSAPSTETSFASPGPVFQFGKPPPATVTATTSVPGGPAFGQAPSISTAPTTTVGFSIFGGTTLTSSTPATTGQAMLTFGSSGSAFGSSFSTSTKPLPPYPGTASQPTFSAGATESQPPASKPAAGSVSFTPTFSFGAPTAQSAAQPAFGSGAQPAFGTASAQGSFGTSSAQEAFRTATSVLSFGTATPSTASFSSTTQTTSSTTIFGTTPSPFTFGATAQLGPSTGTFGIGTPALSSGSPAVPFSFSAGQSGAAPAAMPFGSSLTQSALGAQNQSTPFAFSMPSTPNNPMFGGTPAPTFGQSTPVPGAVGSGSSSLSFGTPSTAASGFGAVGTSFGSSTPAFSIGAGSKMGARQRLQARRQHTRKK